MKLEIDLDSTFLVDAIFQKMKSEKMVVPMAGRVEPYTAKEIMDHTDVSVSTLDRMTDAGVLVRCGVIGKRLFTAASVEDWYRKGGGSE